MKTSETMYDRLEWVLGEIGKTPSVASIEIGYQSKNTLREVLIRNKEREFTSSLLIGLYKTYGVSPNWILLGIGKPFLNVT